MNVNHVDREFRWGLWIMLGVAILLAIASTALSQQPNDVASFKSLYVPITPCRLADTRSDQQYLFTGQYGPPRVESGQQRTFLVAGADHCGVPTGATGVAFNFAAADTPVSNTYSPSIQNGVLRAFPTGGPAPLIAVLNWTQNTGIVSNSAVIPVSPAGELTIEMDGAGTYGNIVIDVFGYYVPHVEEPICSGFIQVCANPGGDNGRNLALPPCNPGQTLVSIPVACPEAASSKRARRE